jgi:hypothetical protein
MTVREAAAYYAALGIRVIPLHGIKNGRCTCGKPNDAPGHKPGKHPVGSMTPNGADDASCDTEQVRRWFGGTAALNLALVLGDLVAIDEDQPGAILAAGIELPNCPASKTGRGLHYVFRSNGAALQNGDFAPGLECKTGNGYIVAPPSLHLSGHRYTWVAGHSLEDLEPPALPDDVARMIVAAHGKANGAGKDSIHDIFGRLKLEPVFAELEALKVDQGARWRDLMLRLVRSLVGRGLRDEMILTIMRRTTRSDLGYTHDQTDAWVADEIRRIRQKDNRPEPEETFNQVDGETPQPVGCLGASVMPQPTDWLWYPYFAAGEINLIGARGGVGKGQSCASIVARLTTGILWPDGSEKAHVGHVLWAEAEDSIEKTVVPRLIANKANLELVTFFNEEEFAALDLKTFITTHACRAVILSPIMSFLPRLKSHIDELAVRAALKNLKSAVDGSPCALIGIAHLNKKTDLDAIERLLGSVAFANFVRSVVLIASDKEQKDARRCIHAKYNLSERGRDLLFRTVHVGEDPRDQFVKGRVGAAQRRER